jgi:hypothetical protein
VAVVVQERGDLRADDGRRGAAVVVHEPVVHTRAEIGEGVARERRRGCGEGLSGRARGREEAGAREGGGDDGRSAGQRPRALWPRRPPLVRVVMAWDRADIHDGGDDWTD